MSAGSHEGPSDDRVKVFLSYASEDFRVVSPIYDQLAALGLKPWMDKRDLLPGQQWREIIPDAIQQSDFVLVFLSPRSVDKRGFFQSEVRTALKVWEEKLPQDIYLVPVLLEPCSVPRELTGFQWVDLNDEIGWSMLLRAILFQTERLGRVVPAALTGALPPPGVMSYKANLIAEQRDLLLYSANLMSRWRSTERMAPEFARQLRAVLGEQFDAASARVKQIETLLEGPIVLEEPIRLELIRIPAGEFLMGSDPAKDSQAFDGELPQPRVDLSEYYIGKYDVTNAQYQAFARATEYEPPRDWEDGRIPVGKENHPVVHVSWHDAVAFCEWLSQKTGREFRLPTEAEWEKAARGTDGREYPWGNEPPTPDLCNFGMNVGHTTPVGQYPKGASPYDVLDMVGNVWEWTDSQYDQSGPRRVVRGGSYIHHAGREFRCAFRLDITPGSRHFDLGFRVCAVIQQE